MKVVLAAAIMVLASTAAHAQDRPSDADIFGAPASPSAETPAPASSAETLAPAPAQAPTSTDTRDDSILGDAQGPALSTEAAPDDPLRMGGLFYLRASSRYLQAQKAKDISFSSPSLLDVYLDARPNDRVRGFVLGRMSFDPTLPQGGEPVAASEQATSGTGGPSGTMGSAPLSSLSGSATRGPHVTLDQLWLRFDLKRTVFVTAGKQHVRWGTARFWTPTDFLHTFRRNPLDVFDARTGTTMLKLHLPWEDRGWNFYAYAVAEQTAKTAVVADIALAARAEVVWGSTEVGLGAMVQRNHKPKLALDVSSGLGEFDVYGEVALRNRSEIDRVRYDGSAQTPVFGERPPWQSQEDFRKQTGQQIAEAFFPRYSRDDWRPQVAGGVTYQRKYNDNDMVTVGAEAFYNPLGYSRPEPYLGLLMDRAVPLRDPATFFYLGRQYAAVFINVPAPYSWNYTTFTASTLGNLSDGSYISRVDYSLVLLTHLRFEAFAAVHYGNTNGEFRFGLRNFALPGGMVFNQAPGLLDLGVALRVSL